MARPIENTERVTIFITKEQLTKVQEAAKAKGMSVSGYIRLLIIENMDAQK